jgi:hypothetical protein
MTVLLKFILSIRHGPDDSAPQVYVIHSSGDFKFIPSIRLTPDDSALKFISFIPLRPDDSAP